METMDDQTWGFLRPDMKTMDDQTWGHLRPDIEAMTAQGSGMARHGARENQTEGLEISAFRVRAATAARVLPCPYLFGGALPL